MRDGLMAVIAVLCMIFKDHADPLPADIINSFKLEE